MNNHVLRIVAGLAPKRDETRGERRGHYSARRASFQPLSHVAPLEQDLQIRAVDVVERTFAAPVLSSAKQHGSAERSGSGSSVPLYAENGLVP